MDVLNEPILEENLYNLLLQVSRDLRIYYVTSGWHQVNYWKICS